MSPILRRLYLNQKNKIFIKNVHFQMYILLRIYNHPAKKIIQINSIIFKKNNIHL